MVRLGKIQSAGDNINPPYFPRLQQSFCLGFSTLNISLGHSVIYLFWNIIRARWGQSVPLSGRVGMVKVCVIRCPYGMGFSSSRFQAHPPPRPALLISSNVTSCTWGFPSWLWRGVLLYLLCLWCYCLVFGFPLLAVGGCPTLPLVSLVPLSCVCRDPLFVQCRDPGVVALEYRKYDDDDRRVQSSTSLPQHQVLRVRLSLDQI